MNFNKFVFLFGFAIITMTITGKIIFAEEAMIASTDQAVVALNQQSDAQKESDMQWVWGEVTNLDNQAKTVTLKCFDYETDQDKELVLVVDEKTTLENIKDFNDLKLNDALSVDYIIGADNKNIAKNISFEEPDTSSPALPEATASNLAPPMDKSEMPVDSSEVNEAPAPAPAESAPAPAPAESAPAPAESAPAPAPAESAPAPAESAPAPAPAESAPAPVVQG
jgi:hypothetical protein